MALTKDQTRKLNEAHETAMLAKQQVDNHEKNCADRYTLIHDTLNVLDSKLSKVIWYIIGGLGAVIGLILTIKLF